MSITKHTESLSYYGFEQRLKELWLQYSWRLIKFEYTPLEYKFYYEIQEYPEVVMSGELNEEFKRCWKTTELTTES